MSYRQPRFSAQCGKILKALREGPVTNADLSKIALKYTSRISDLRKYGHKIACTFKDRKAGITVYELKRSTS